MGRTVIDAIESEFHRYRGLAEQASGQLPWEDLRVALDPQVNSIAVVMKHIGGNLRSRWTDPFTTDGEKPWRERDREFVDDFRDRAELDRVWAEGWSVLERVLREACDDDLARSLVIRGEPHSLSLALARSLSHTAYHCGQIVQAARVLASRRGIAWKTLTVPRGGSVAFNASKGFDPAAPARTPPAV